MVTVAASPITTPPTAITVMVYIVQGVKSVKMTLVALVVAVFMVALLPVIAYCIRYSDMESVGVAGSIHDTLTAVELSATAVRLTGGPRAGDDVAKPVERDQLNLLK